MHLIQSVFFFFCYHIPSIIEKELPVAELQILMQTEIKLCSAVIKDQPSANLKDGLIFQVQITKSTFFFLF